MQFGLVGIVGQRGSVVLRDHRDVVGTHPEPGQRPGQGRIPAAPAGTEGT